MSDPTKAVFLSYASQDAEAAKRICEALRAAGIEVWFDLSELVGGDQWDHKIRGQIGSCALFVPVISANTQARLEGYFRLEWKLAAQRTHTMADEKAFLLPVLIDATRDAEAKVPGEFRAVQWTKLLGGDATPSFCARVKKLLAGESSTGATAAPIERFGGPAPTRRGFRWWWVGPIFGMTMALMVVLKESSKERTVLEPPAKGVRTPLTPAHQLVAKVWEQLNKPGLSRIELEVADDLAERAAALDGMDAEVVAAGAQVDSWFVYHGYDVTSERKEHARRKAARALQLAPHDFETRLAQACYLVRGGGQISPESAGPAEALLTMLLSESPDEPRTLLALGTLQERTGLHAAARATFEKLARNPAFAAQAWNEIGWSAMHAADFRLAETAVDRSIALEPYWSNLSLRAWLAISWRGDPAQAKAAIERIPVAVMQEDFVISMVTWVHWYRRDGPAILRMLKGVSRDWLSSTMMNGPIASYAAFGHQIAGEKDAARVEWRAALQTVDRLLAVAPNSPNLLFWRGLVLLELGQKDEGEAALHLSAELAGGSPQGYGLAIQEVLRGRLDDAVAALEFGADHHEFHIMPALLRRDPHCDALREMPRFKALLARLDADPRFATNEPLASEKLETKK